MSIILEIDNEDANLEKTRQGVNKSTFKALITFCPWIFNNPVLAAKKPAKHIITTSKTASKVRNEISNKDNDSTGLFSRLDMYENLFICKSSC